MIVRPETAAQYARRASATLDDNFRRLQQQQQQQQQTSTVKIMSSPIALGPRPRTGLPSTGTTKNSLPAFKQKIRHKTKSKRTDGGTLNSPSELLMPGKSGSTSLFLEESESSSILGFGTQASRVVEYSRPVPPPGLYYSHEKNSTIRCQSPSFSSAGYISGLVSKDPHERSHAFLNPDGHVTRNVGAYVLPGALDHTSQSFNKFGLSLPFLGSPTDRTPYEEFLSRRDVPGMLPFPSLALPPFIPPFALPCYRTPYNTPYQHILSTHHIFTSYQRALSTLSLSTQGPLNTMLIITTTLSALYSCDIRYHILLTHPINTATLSIVQPNQFQTFTPYPH